MKTRIITGAVLLVVMAVILALSGTWVYFAAVTLLSIVGTWEMLGCTGHRKTLCLSAVSVTASAVCPILMYLYGFGAALSLTVLLLFALLFISVFKSDSIKTQDVCVVFATTLYVYACFSALLSLRYVELDEKIIGQYVFVLVFVAAWITDTFAYFVGVFFGKTKLIPKVSPKKTVEGSVGGMVFCVIAFAVYGLIINRISDITPNYIGLCFTGLVLSAVSQLGDLLASAIKRSYGIKDYGNIFPGHGGVLDRFDSVMAVAPLLLMLTGNPQFMSILFK